MTDMTKSRGRPVGSGIDDCERLKAIATLIAANPGMKPTTAIKALGIMDTSVIRRLRDKLKASHPGICGMSGARHTSAQTCAARADVARPFKISEDVAPPKQPAPERVPGPRRVSPPSDPSFVASLELALTAWTAVLTAQLAMFDQLMQNPSVRAMLHQHVTASELALSLTRISAPPRRPA